MGLDSIKRELTKVGIDSVGGEDDEGLGGRMMTMDEFEAIEIDPEVKAVVAGLD